MRRKVKIDLHQLRRSGAVEGEEYEKRNFREIEKLERAVRK
jgi:hypothetical protein